MGRSEDPARIQPGTPFHRGTEPLLRRARNGRGARSGWQREREASFLSRNRQFQGAAPVPVAILFENNDGKIGYRVVRNLKDSAQVDAPPLTSSVDAIRNELTAMLVQSGLYPKEAAAMLETWRDSWFEPGTRVIYIDPRSTVDAILPMRISPAPQKIERVFVGRVEVLSPATETAIRTAMEAGDAAAIEKLGRFLPAFHWEMINHGKLSRTTPGEPIAGRIDGANYRGDASCIR